MDELKVRNMNPLSLAYMGDAVYESFVRERLMNGSEARTGKADLLHKAGVRYVNAAAQAAALAEIRPLLTETEDALVKRARNHITATKAKNADIITYKWATAFEALIGYLYLSEQKERLARIMEQAALCIEHPGSYSRGKEQQ